jgi:hypothetical protein
MPLSQKPSFPVELVMYTRMKDSDIHFDEDSHQDDENGQGQSEHESNILQ